MPQQNKRGDAGHSAGVPARPHKPVPSDKTASTKSVTHTRSSEHTSPNVSQRQKTQQVVRNGQAGGKTRTNLPQQTRRSMTASEQQTPTKRRTSTNALSNTSTKMGRGANRSTVTQSRRNQKRAQKQREEARKAAAAQRAQAKKQAEKEQRKKKKAFYRAQRRRVWRARLKLFCLMFVVLLLLCAGAFSWMLHTVSNDAVYGITYQVGRSGENDTSEGDGSGVLEEKISAGKTFRDGVMYLNFTPIADMCDMIVTGDRTQMRYTASDNLNETAIFYIGDTWAEINGASLQMSGPALLDEDGVWLPMDFIDTYVLGIDCIVDGHDITVVRSYVNESLDALKYVADAQEQSVRYLLKGAVPMERPAEAQMTVAMEFAVDLSDYEAYMNPQNRDDYLVLVNKDHPMSADQEPSYDSMSEVGYEIRDGVKARFMDKTAELALTAMFMDMRALGYEDVWVYEGYRSYSSLNYLYQQAQQNGEEGTVPQPGVSDCQTGLSCDIFYEDGAQDVTFGTTPAGQWLAQNSWKYGFILRYPQDKVEQTGVGYQPWHFRFVGRFHAMRMHNNNQCLEEYLEDLQQRGYFDT